METTCRCCQRSLTEFDADWVETDPASGAILVLVAPADLLCGPCADPESRPWAHATAHGLMEDD